MRDWARTIEDLIRIWRSPLSRSSNLFVARHQLCNNWVGLAVATLTVNTVSSGDWWSVWEANKSRFETNLFAVTQIDVMDGFVISSPFPDSPLRLVSLDSEEICSDETFDRFGPMRWKLIYSEPHALAGDPSRQAGPSGQRELLWPESGTTLVSGYKARANHLKR